MASLAVGGVFLLAMIVASVWAAVTLPPGARIAIHCGFVEHCYLAPKRVGLIIWPALGALVFVVLGGIAASRLAADWVPGVRDVLVPAVLGVLLAFQAGALALARRGFAGVPEQRERETSVRSDLKIFLVGCGRPYHDRTASRTGRRHEDRQQPGPGNAGLAAR